MDEKKIEKCRFAHEGRGGKYFCTKAGWEDDEVTETNEDKCENCQSFKSRYIEYPIKVEKIETQPIKFDSWCCEMGKLVAVRPCGDEYKGKTFLGFFLGELPLTTSVSYNESQGILKVSTIGNPAMFVPELGKIIWGCGSWWNEINSKDELKQITDIDIDNVWYVKLAKALSDKEK